MRSKTAIKQFSTKDPINHWPFNFRGRWKFFGNFFFFSLFLSQTLSFGVSSNTRLVSALFRTQIKLPAHGETFQRRIVASFFGGRSLPTFDLQPIDESNVKRHVGTCTNPRLLSIVKEESMMIDVMTWFSFQSISGNQMLSPSLEEWKSQENVDAWRSRKLLIERTIKTN